MCSVVVCMVGGGCVCWFSRIGVWGREGGGVCGRVRDNPEILQKVQIY